jgi:hypothetical protein
MEGTPKHDIRNLQRISRRSFLVKGAASVGTLGSVGLIGKIGLDYRGEQNQTEREVSSQTHSAEQEENIEPYNELSDSGYFMEDVRRFTEEMRAEVPEVLDNVDVYAAIEEYFVLSKIDSATVRNNLEALAPALAFTESRYKDVASEKGAFGVMQLMPKTWAELAKEDEEIDSVEAQIKVAARLMEQTYRYLLSSCKDELAYIEGTFFGGDTESFETACLTPCLLNAYNAGMGTMAQLIKDFIELYPNPASTVELFEQSETLTGYDVFIGMTHTALQQEWVDWYKDIAANYTCKVYGAHRAVAEYLVQQREAT